MNRDLEVKSLQFTYLEGIVGGVKRTKNVSLIEQDVIDLYFKRKSDKTNQRAYGHVIKIGIDDDNRYYFTLLAYQYQEDSNLYKIHIDEVVKINNLVHSATPYVFNPVYNHDESAILIKAVDGVLFFSKDGEEWLAAGSGGEGGGDHPFKPYKENGVCDDSSTNDTVPTSKVVYDSIVALIDSAKTALTEDYEQKISDAKNDIDNTVDGISQRLETAERSITTIETTVSDHGTAISDLSNTVNGLSDTVGEVQNTVSGISDNVAGLKEDVDALKEHEDSDFYNDCVAAGYNGTREDLAAIIVQLANNINKIVVANGHDGEGNNG